jgi:hypothetical protein
VRPKIGTALVVFLFCLISVGEQYEAALPDRTSSADLVANAGVPHRSGADSPVRVTRSDQHGVAFTCQFGELNVTGSPDGSIVKVAGANSLAEPGSPDLPSRIVLVGVPQSGDVRLSATVGKARTVATDRIRPAPGYGPFILSVGFDHLMQPAAAEIVAIENLRGLRVARIRLNPVTYDHSTGILTLLERIDVTVAFEGQPVKSARHDPLVDVLSRSLVNGDLAASWLLPQPEDTARFFDRHDVWYKVLTETTGVYGIRRADLSSAGVDVSVINPTTFRLYSIGPYRTNEEYPDTMIEVPVFLEGEDDGSFDANDFIAFYAESPARWDDDQTKWISNPFTAHSCYWLTWGDGQGLRFETESGAGASAPATTARHHVHLELERLSPARSGLLWLWRNHIKQEGLPSDSFAVAIELPHQRSIDTLRIRFYARTAAKSSGGKREHNKIRAFLNGHELDTIAFFGQSSGPPPATLVVGGIPDEVLGAGDIDSLTFEVYGDAEMDVFLDYIEALYVEELEVSSETPQLRFSTTESGTFEFSVAGAATNALLLEVTNPWAPVQIVDVGTAGSALTAKVETDGMNEYVCALKSGLRSPVTIEKRTPGRLRRSTAHVDYYIIAPDEFIPAARLLADYRQGNIAGIDGAIADVAPLSEIYDEYGFGVEEPGPIKKFFSLKQPEYGLLAGDATYDYKNNLGVERPPYVPAYESGYDIDPEVYGRLAVAKDAWYADYNDSSGLDMIIGRITCRSRQELRSFLDKLKTYETQTLGFWAKRLLLLADDEWLGSVEKRDIIGFQHISGCESVISNTRGLLDPVKIYLTEYPFTGVNDKAAARVALFEALRNGALLWCFFGHGAGFRLCHERAMDIADVPQVEGSSHNPVAFFGSCGVGRFEDTKTECIAEELVRKDQGCIATVGATKATTPGNNEYFAQEMFRFLVEHPELPLGPAFFQGWAKANPEYHLFGDPATKVRLPGPGIQPVVSPDTFYPGGITVVSDSVPVASGRYEVVVQESRLYRSYYSDAGPTQYILPGYLVHSSSGDFSDSHASVSFTFPSIDYPDTVVVPNGSYVRIPGSGVASFLCWQDGGLGSDRAGYSSRIDTVMLGGRVANQDHTPPSVMPFAEQRKLTSTDTVEVPKNFTLRCVVEDESGILLAPVDSGPGFYIGSNFSDRIALGSYFGYDRNSTSRGSFSYEVEVDASQVVDSITIDVADNLRNRRYETYYIRPLRTDRLQIDSCLVYPNPAAGKTSFTFQLTRPAFVTARIYTISGRLVRELPAQACFFGYNQIEWDGTDRNGLPLGNGIYLYKLEARSSEAASGRTEDFSASCRDKFIVHR